MILFEDALRTVLEKAKCADKEKVKLLDSTNRFLAQNIIADIDMPPFDKSAVDGYACKIDDIHNNLEVLETIAAGDVPKNNIKQNQCSKIMTGAMLPEGADCVLMVEHTQKIDETHIKLTTEKTGINIAYKAEDIKKDTVLLKEGLLIQPQHIALIASVGYSELLVYKQPRVAVLTTGSELVEPDTKPALGQIRNSNAWQIYSQVQKINAIPVYFGIIEDTEEKTDLAIKKAISENDVVILTGGVSMGDFDFVPKILKQNNVDLIFEKIKIRPGKPTVFGVHKDAFVFGLPGNPVSSFVLFEILVKPFLQKMMGSNEVQKNIYLTLGTDFKRAKADVMLWVPSKINEKGEVVPVEYHRSAHVSSLCNADVLFPVSIGVFELKKGDIVNVRQI
ncbi:MAG: molybdopterin molybdotransferase MoeA [Bacteroidia bacterium]|nr:molybdopterin molybdotransferase MoeA [Bacteroidia bacterium]